MAIGRSRRSRNEDRVSASGGFAGAEGDAVTDPGSVIVAAGDVLQLAGLRLVAGEGQLFAVEAQDELVLLAFELAVPQLLHRGGGDVNDGRATLEVGGGEIVGVQI